MGAERRLQVGCWPSVFRPFRGAYAARNGGLTVAGCHACFFRSSRPAGRLSCRTEFKLGGCVRVMNKLAGRTFERVPVQKVLPALYAKTLVHRALC